MEQNKERKVRGKKGEFERDYPLGKLFAFRVTNANHDYIQKLINAIPEGEALGTFASEILMLGLHFYEQGARVKIKHTVTTQVEFTE